ncbi:MAG: hypothetical protein NW237_04615 [Cyanobacteriota bacterium]|nr:hypothetical protein [Cyanobacteriota bacterium]
MSILKSALRPQWIPCALLGAVASAITLLLTPHLSLAQETAPVPAAEASVQILLPEGATIIGSRLLAADQAEVLVESQGRVSPIIMKRVGNQWQQDMEQTLARSASDMKSLAQANQTLAAAPAFGQTAPEPAVGETLLESTQSVSDILIAPADIETETERAERAAGRSDPFAPLNEIVEPVPTDALPPLPSIPVPDNVVGSDILPGELPEPTPDPAAFAKTVQVSGVIQIDGDAYALVSAGGAIPAVVQPGQKYESADVTGVSARRKEVILSEGGQRIVLPVVGGVAPSTTETSTSPGGGS